MKTLGIDCRLSGNSGIGVYLRNLAPRCMALLRDEARFVLLGYRGDFPVPRDCSWRAAPFAAPVYSLAEQWARPAASRDCDALWTPHYPIPVFARPARVVTVHDTAHLALADVFSPPQRLYARFMFQAVRRKAAEIIFVSEFTRREFLRLVGPPKGAATVIHNGVDSARTDRGPSRPAPRRYFLAVGNLKPHKNIPLLCRSFARTAQAHDADLIIAGEYRGFRGPATDPRGLEALCPGRIRCLGPVEPETLIELTAGAEALVFPSRYEGFGLPPLEALALGVPVLASDIPAVREVCADLPAYFPPGDEESLARGLTDILALPPEERRARADAGREHARRFSWESAAAATARVLRRALGTKERPGEVELFCPGNNRPKERNA